MAKDKKIVGGKVVGHPVNPGINQLGHRIEFDGQDKGQKKPERQHKVKVKKESEPPTDDIDIAG